MNMRAPRMEFSLDMDEMTRSNEIYCEYIGVGSSCVTVEAVVTLWRCDGLSLTLTLSPAHAAQKEI